MLFTSYSILENRLTKFCNFRIVKSDTSVDSIGYVRLNLVSFGEKEDKKL